MQVYKLSYMQLEKFWPISVEVIVWYIIKKCIICYKIKSSVSETIMSNLLASKTITTVHTYWNRF